MDLKLFFKVSCLVLFLNLGGMLSAQTSQPSQLVENYIVGLEEASEFVDFRRTFQEMVRSLHRGELSFTDAQVKKIVDVARGKSFANNILPSVFQWAATMYGDGRMHEAVIYFLESAELCRQKHKKLAEALSYFQIALIQHKAGNYQEAEEYYHKTLLMGSDSLDHRTRINCYNGFALIFRETEKYDSAIRQFRNAVEIARDSRDTVWMGILAGNIGSIHLRTENYDSSLHYYYKNLKLVRNTSETENKIETYAHLGRVYAKMKNHTMAFAYLDTAQQIVRDRKFLFNDFFNPLDYIYESYSIIHSDRGDFKKAFHYQREFHNIAREKQRRLDSRRLKQLQSTYNFKSEQSELELLRQINAANMAIIRQQRLSHFAFGGIILLVSILAFFAFKSSRQRKALNKQLSRSNDELMRLNSIKDKLFSVISHDLRAPLANLNSFMGIMKAGHLEPEELNELSAKLNQQIEASENALENLLQWAKAQLSDDKVSPEKISIAEIVRKVLRQFTPELEAKKITCTYEGNENIIAYADPNQTEIILRNLISNAIKFTAEGGEVRIIAAIGKEVCIEIRDNGVGMSEDQLKHIFQPGKHFTKPGTNQERGTGIGLFIVKEMVINNGGDIWIRSKKDQGSQFFFTLPSCEKANNVRYSSIQ